MVGKDVDPDCLAVLTGANPDKDTVLRVAKQLVKFGVIGLTPI
jgi:hypothetical protein